MGRRVSVVLATVLCVVLLAALPASAAIRIKKIVYDPSGSDTGTNYHLNKEVVVLTNTGTRGRKLGGWTVRDASGHVYRIPSGFVLKPGKVVRIHTGKGVDDSNDLYWRSGWYIWNNTGDRAVLKNRAGTVVDRCQYSGGGSVAYC